MVATRAQRRDADRVAGVLEQSSSAQAANWPDTVHPAFATRLLQRFRECGEVASALRAQLTAALESKGQTVEDAIREDSNA